MKQLTITAFARCFGLSRSTLLYYDRIGLLKPSGHSASGYRLYSEQDTERMRRIDTFRKAGLSLRSIQEILDAATGDAMEHALEQRLSALNEELAVLRAQQQLVIQLLQRRGKHLQKSSVDVMQWVKMLEEAGMDEEAKQRWHFAFERDAPEAHREFLLSLGLNEAEVAEIRRLSHAAWSGS